jgi:polygalacturonase
MDDQLIGKTIYHPGGPLTDQNQMLGRTSLYKEDGTPLEILSADESDNRYPRVYTPEAYGAVGDGTTNDTAAIQASIDAAEAAGG